MNKNEAILWLEQQISHPVVTPKRTDTLAQMRSDFQALKYPQVAIYGTGSGGLRLKAILEKQNIKIAYFVDSFSNQSTDGIPTYLPSDAPNDNLPLLISSTWFVDILKGIDQTTLGKRDNIFVIPDPSFLTTDIFDDMVGYEFYSTFIRRFEDYKAVWSLLEDSHSKQTFLKVCAYRLGFFSPQNLSDAVLPMTSYQYQKTTREVPKLPASFENGLSRATKECFGHPHYIIDDFSAPKRGDHVFDCGAWEGDTTFWYHHFVGKEGKVYAFEPSQFNCHRLRQQLKLSSSDTYIHVEPIAIGAINETQYWDDVPEAGTCSRLSSKNTGMRVDVESIDSFCERTNVQKVDILKTDLEGADFDAIKGAFKTISQFKPQLAISIYHTADQMVDIPLWINKNFPDYRLRINHNHMGVNETICLAVPHNRNSRT